MAEEKTNGNGLGKAGASIASAFAAILVMSGIMYIAIKPLQQQSDSLKDQLELRATITEMKIQFTAIETQFEMTKEMSDYKSLVYEKDILELQERIKQLEAKK